LVADVNRLIFNDLHFHAKNGRQAPGRPPRTRRRREGTQPHSANDLSKNFVSAAREETTGWTLGPTYQPTGSRAPPTQKRETRKTKVTLSPNLGAIIVRFLKLARRFTDRPNNQRSVLRRL